MATNGPNAATPLTTGRSTDVTRNGDTTPLIATTLAVLFIAATPFISWFGYGKILEQQSIGNGLGLSAVILAVGGFGITIWQILRTKSASRAAENAVDNLRFRLEAFEDQQLCRDCLALCTEIERLHEVVWQTKPTGGALATHFFLPERYRTLHLTLTKLRTRMGGNLGANEQTIVQSAVAKLSDATKGLNRNLRNPKGTPFPKLEPLQVTLQTLAEMLTALSVDLDQRAIGENDDQR
jgi:hypothetical protein